MRDFFRKINASMQKFMYGRNGVDAYNQFLLILGLTLDIIGMILRSTICMILCDLLLVYVFYRILSKNLVKRSMENQKYLQFKSWGRHIHQAHQSNKQDHQHHYFVCPQCHRIVRVPTGHGKITITCPTCGKEFSRKS